MTQESDDHDRSIRSEERLCANDKAWTAHATVHDLEAKALSLQHDEYERRLEALNHEGARIAADKVTYASRELVDGAVREINQKIEATAILVGKMLPREVYDSTQQEVDKRALALADTVTSKPSKDEHNALAERTKALELGSIGKAAFEKQSENTDMRLKALESWKARASGVAVVLTIFAGLAGAAVMRALGG